MTGQRRGQTARADLLVHSLQTRADTHTPTDKQTQEHTHACTRTPLPGRCMKIIERINLTWAEISFRLFGLFHKAQHGGKIMSSSLGYFLYWCLATMGTWGRWYLVLKSIVHILKRLWSPVHRYLELYIVWLFLIYLYYLWSWNNLDRVFFYSILH